MDENTAQPQAGSQPQPQQNPQPQQQRPPHREGGQRPYGERRERPQGDRPRRVFPPRDPSERNVIYVGKKETMAYVLAVVTQFNSGLSEVHIKARGKSITAAVDISQIVKNRFMPGLQIKSVTLGTEELTSEDGRQTKVSSMDILLVK